MKRSNGNKVLPLDVYIHRDLLCPLFDRLARPSALDSTTVSRSYFEGNQDLTNIARINFNANRITHMFVEYSRHNAHWASRIFHLRTNNTIYSCTFRERLIFQIERKFSPKKKKSTFFFNKNFIIVKTFFKGNRTLQKRKHFYKFCLWSLVSRIVKNLDYFIQKIVDWIRAFTTINSPYLCIF